MGASVTRAALWRSRTTRATRARPTEKLDDGSSKLDDGSSPRRRSLLGARGKRFACACSLSEGSTMTDRTAHDDTAARLTKVPAVTLGFWIIKIAATTLGRDRRRHRHHDDESGILDGHGDLPHASRRPGRRADRRRRSSIRSSTGRPSSPPRQPARRWPISPTARSGSATPAVRFSWLGCVIAVLGSWYWSEGTISVEHRQHAQGGSVLLG